MNPAECANLHCDLIFVDEQVQENDDGSYQCRLCGKRLQLRGNDSAYMIESGLETRK